VRGCSAARTPRWPADTGEGRRGGGRDVRRGGTSGGWPSSQVDAHAREHGRGRRAASGSRRRGSGRRAGRATTPASSAATLAGAERRPRGAGQLGGQAPRAATARERAGVRRGGTASTRARLRGRAAPTWGCASAREREAPRRSARTVRASRTRSCHRRLRVRADHVAARERHGCNDKQEAPVHAPRAAAIHV
jgi:hypothetical protein